MKQFKDVVETHNVIMRKVAVLWGLYIPGLGFLGNIGTLIILWYGGYKVLDGDLSIGALTAFLLYLGMFFGPIHVLGELYNQALAAVAGAGRVFDLLDTPVEIADRENARAVPCIQGAVSFEHVFLRYSDDEQSPWVLEDISFQARSGQTIALVGPTGGGKSSILNLLVRFYEPQRGQICIDDIPVHDITLESLHRQTAIVQQDNFLFTGTVMDNIRYGRPDASDESVIDAARATGAHALIARMDKGYHTQVRERGAALSQGERQLICITRALLADPRILILDEATSAVDTHTEKILQGALETLFQDRTVFVVAHRLSTIRNADQVMVIHHGRIVERGTHAHLLACNGMYTGMHRQFAQLVPS